MTRFTGLQDLFKRDRRPGDLVFAGVFFAGAVFLVTQLDSQAPWNARANTFTQPAFWPSVAVYAMAGFAALHLLSTLLSPRRPGRGREVLGWLRALEFGGWFLAYVALVPWLGYLPVTLVLAVLLGLRAGYRSRRMLAALCLAGGAIVVVFKGLLQVKIPGGAVYEYLPTTLRSIFLTYF